MNNNECKQCNSTGWKWITLGDGEPERDVCSCQHRPFSNFEKAKGEVYGEGRDC